MFSFTAERMSNKFKLSKVYCSQEGSALSSYGAVDILRCNYRDTTMQPIKSYIAAGGY